LREVMISLNESIPSDRILRFLVVHAIAWILLGQLMSTAWQFQRVVCHTANVEFCALYLLMVCSISFLTATESFFGAFLRELFVVGEVQEKGAFSEGGACEAGTSTSSKDRL